MSKLWEGLTDGETNKLADEFNSSIDVDFRMYKQDIDGSIAHAKMLNKCNIISTEDSCAIIDGLYSILNDIDEGKLEVDNSCEDIHMFVEQELTKRIGDAGKKLHTARSRNDQVALDLRLYIKDEMQTIFSLLNDFVNVIIEIAEKNKDSVMPGYTHLQHAQPISFAHHVLSYAYMFTRDQDRLISCFKRSNISPIGSCALAGTTYDTDRSIEAHSLGFRGFCENSIDGVSDRDFCLELLSCLSIIMTHTSRLCEELILWSSWEFQFIELPQEFTTGSSIMPNKKNPDMAELIRGKTGRVYGDLITMLTVLKGTPLAYNKDMQEDKEAVFDACDTVKYCLVVLSEMLKDTKINAERMKESAKHGFINATDLADYLVKKGVPFRDAYKISGKAVAYCTESNKFLEDLSIEEYQKFDVRIQDDVYEYIDITNCMNNRKSYGGTSKENVDMQIKNLRKRLSLPVNWD